MLAYIFWHRPYPTVEKPAYEAALTRFHNALGKTSCPGFRGSATYRISETPWLDGKVGYEDWNLLDSSAAMDPLNEAAVAPAMWDTHAAIAEQTDFGHGGLYRYLLGEADPSPFERVFWLTRPRGIRYEAPLSAIADQTGEAFAFSLWRKQMVLGPAPEFALLTDATDTPSLPADWRLLEVRREQQLY
jgi:hypothetical protein